MAFFIARRWRVPIVKKLTSIERVSRLRKYIPESLFWSVVVFRAGLPIDVISYVLGLFTDMEWSKYTIATALDLAPSAFLLVYLGRTPTTQGRSMGALEVVSCGTVNTVWHSAPRTR